MATAFSLSPDEATALAAMDPLRRCLACGEPKPKTELIRFVLGPDGVLVPDLAARLPGRGLWVSARREALSTVFAKNPFSRAAKTKVIVPPDLLFSLETLLARRCLDLLGLAKGAGVVIFGLAQLEQAMASSALSFVLMARDAGGDIRKKLSRAVCLESGLSREALGVALGREALAAVGLAPHALAKRVREEFARWNSVRAQDNEDKNTLTESDKKP